MLLLIALAHAPLFLYTAEPGIMHRAESITFFDQIANLFGMFFIDNRARAMFAVLLGYGIVLSFESHISKGKSETDALKMIRRRSLYLILFGIIVALDLGEHVSSSTAAMIAVGIWCLSVVLATVLEKNNLNGLYKKRTPS